MGNGLSVALGKNSLHDENKVVLDNILHHLRADDRTDPHLDLANAYVGDEGLRLGANSLNSNSVVTSLDLSSNGITPAGLAHLLQALERRDETARYAHQHQSTDIATPPPLLSLNLSGNTALGDEGAQLLAGYLAKQPPLEELSLYHCGITDQGLHSLINALAQGNRTLAVLRLDMNYITDAGLEMLLQLVTLQREDDMQYPDETEDGQPTFFGKGVGHVTLTQNPGPFAASLLAELKEMSTPGREALMVRHQAIAAMEAEHARQIAEAEAQARREDDEARRREEEAMAEAADRDAQDADETQKVRDALNSNPLVKSAQQPSVTKTSGSLKASPNTSAMDRQSMREANESRIQKNLDAAYAWRDRLTGNGTLVKEWRDGFTVMRTKEGDAPGTVPSLVPEAPRRLKACWCDPHDVSAPYAKTLHYHCKFESAAGQQMQHASTTRSNKGGDSGTSYRACRATGHVCATVGFFAKPLPDRSAAHFFASQHPSTIAS